MGIRWRNFVFKIVETVLYIVTSVLVGVCEGTHGIKNYFIFIGLTSYFWMVVVLIFSLIIANPVHKIINFLLCLVFALYGIVGGALAMEGCRDMFEDTESENAKFSIDILIMTGLLAFCLAAIYIVDGFSELFAEVRPSGNLLFCFVFAIYALIAAALLIQGLQDEIIECMESSDQDLLHFAFFTSVLAIALAAVYILDAFVEMFSYMYTSINRN